MSTNIRASRPQIRRPTCADAPCWCSARKCFRWSASSAATSPARPGRNTRPRGKVCGIALPAGLKESDACPSRSSRRRPRPRPGTTKNFLRRRCATSSASKPPATCAISRCASTRRPPLTPEPRHHHRRHQVRVWTHRQGHHPGGRSPHSRFLPLLARRQVRSGTAAGIVRQAVRSRLPRADSLEQATARAGPSAGRGTSHQRKIS